VVAGSAALRPAWFDEARQRVQGPVFRSLTADLPLAGRVLNAGCGEGLHSEFLESFASISGIVNLDLTNPKIALTRGDRRHRDSKGSLTTLPFASGYFDVCLCSQVLELVVDHEKPFPNWRCVREGGVLLMSVPTPPAPSMSIMSERVTNYGRHIVTVCTPLVFCFTSSGTASSAGSAETSPRVLLRSFGASRPLPEVWLPVGVSRSYSAGRGGLAASLMNVLHRSRAARCWRTVPREETRSSISRWKLANTRA
jgi:SAM-dependent methyltransferase